MSVLDAGRTIVKLFPGMYDEDARYTGTIEVFVYGPATIRTVSVSPTTGTAVLRARDLSLTGNASCGAPSLIAPASTMDLERVSIVSPADYSSVGAGHCNVRLSHVTARPTASAGTAYGVVIQATSTLLMEESWIDSAAVTTTGSAGIRVAQASRATIKNSVLANGLAAISYDSSTTASSVSFTTFYNTVWNCATGNVLWTSNNNIYLNETSNAPADTVTGTECSHSYDLIKPQATTLGTTNILNQDPRFVNGANGDFHLVAGSPAIDAADPSASEAADYDGTARPQGTGRDIGAFEYKP